MLSTPHGLGYAATVIVVDDAYLENFRMIVQDIAGALEIPSIPALRPNAVTKTVERVQHASDYAGCQPSAGPSFVAMSVRICT